MNFLTNRSKTPLELTGAFVVLLTLSYLVFFTFSKDYGSFIMMLSSSVVATLFDMHVVSSGNYLTDVTLVSNIGLQNSMTNQVAFAQLPLNQMAIDKIMTVITNTPLMLALIVLLVRSFKVLAIAVVIVVSVQILSVASVMSYFMIEVAPQSPILMVYLKSIGVTQMMVDMSFAASSLSLYYVKFFTPLLVAFYAWEANGHAFAQVVTQKESVRFSTLLNTTKG